MRQLIRSGRILIFLLSVCSVVIPEIAPAQTPFSTERSAKFDAEQRGQVRGRRSRGRSRRERGQRRGPEFEHRMKYREAGKLLNQLDDELRKFELLTRDDVPKLVARRWRIATDILRDMRKHTERFLEALWLEPIDVEELIASAQPARSMTSAIGIATLRGSIAQLRYLWRRWRDDRDSIDVERYEELKNEAVEVLLTVDTLLSTPTKSLMTGSGVK